MIPAPGDEIPLGLFPLPGVVLFPGVPLPLHVFEPRYRALARDALAGERRIGMVLLRPGWQRDYGGSPAIHPVGCLGTISRSAALEDGRFDLLLVGARRFRVLEEIPGGEYRRARVRILGDRAPPPEDPEGLALAMEVLGRAEAVVPGGITAEGAAAPDLGPLVALAAAACGMPVEGRQEMLEEGDVAGRARILLEWLRPRAAEARSLDRLLARKGRGDPEAN